MSAFVAEFLGFGAGEENEAGEGVAADEGQEDVAHAGGLACAAGGGHVAEGEQLVGDAAARAEVLDNFAQVAVGLLRNPPADAGGEPGGDERRDLAPAAPPELLRPEHLAGGRPHGWRGSLRRVLNAAPWRGASAASQGAEASDFAKASRARAGRPAAGSSSSSAAPPSRPL